MTAIRSPFYQVGIIVGELEPAMQELSRALGVTWGEIKTGDYKPEPIRFVFSVQGPPHIELIEGGEQGPWSSAGGPRLDHIGFWSADLPADKRKLADRGLPIELDGEALGNPIFTYHRAAACGIRVELVSEVRREPFYEDLGEAER